MVTPVAVLINCKATAETVIAKTLNSDLQNLQFIVWLMGRECVSTVTNFMDQPSFEKLIDTLLVKEILFPCGP
jgi:hypothetical protein